MIWPRSSSATDEPRVTPRWSVIGARPSWGRTRIRACLVTSSSRWRWTSCRSTTRTEAKADAVDWVIGELSPFHERHGVYAQGVGPATRCSPVAGSTASCPTSLGFRPDGLVPRTARPCRVQAGRRTGQGPAVRPLPRRSRLLDPAILKDRIEHLPLDPTRRKALLAQVESLGHAHQATATLVQRPLPRRRPDPSRLRRPPED